jgi:hypothetical protein
LNDRFEKIKVNQWQKQFPNSNIRNHNNDNNNHGNKKVTIINTDNYRHKQQPYSCRPSSLQMLHKKNQAKMLIMPLAILLLSSTIVVANSNSILPPAAYAITFGGTKNLSNNGGDSTIPKVQATGNIVYVVWEDKSTGNGDILFKRSTDGGNNFEKTINLSNNNGESRVPQIAKSGSNVYVVWEDRSQGDREIFFRASTDNGAHFNPIKNLSNEPDSDEGRAGIAATGNKVYVVYDRIEFDSGEIFFRASTDNGNSFKSKIDLGHFSVAKIAAVGNNVYVTLIDAFNDNHGLLFTRSTDNGAHFGNPIDIHGDINGIRDPDFEQISAVGNNVYVAWTADTFTLFRASTDNGAHFGPIKKLNENTGFDGGGPTIDSISDNVYVIWGSDDNTIFRASTDNGAHFGSAKILAAGLSQISSIGTAVRTVGQDDSSGNNEVIFQASGNKGNTFGSPKNLSDNAGESIEPQIISSGNNVYVVWQDDSPGNFEIFFKKGVD